MWIPAGNSVQVLFNFSGEPSLFTLVDRDVLNSTLLFLVLRFLVIVWFDLGDDRSSHIAGHPLDQDGVAQILHILSQDISTIHIKCFIIFICVTFLLDTLSLTQCLSQLLTYRLNDSLTRWLSDLLTSYRYNQSVSSPVSHHASICPSDLGALVLWRVLTLAKGLHNEGFERWWCG